MANTRRRTEGTARTPTLCSDGAGRRQTKQHGMHPPTQGRDTGQLHPRLFSATGPTPGSTDHATTTRQRTSPPTCVLKLDLTTNAHPPDNGAQAHIENKTGPDESGAPTREQGPPTAVVKTGPDHERPSEKHPNRPE